ncbi:MAG: hypothetical protein KQH63_16225 [Desulfobulbaceae bacterium]|nr:hypothetical protein [Desulfobulbaceae bacterium]
MRQMRIFFFLIITLAAVQFLTHSQSSAMMQHVQFDEIIAQADLAFVGRVVDKESRYTEKPRMINTDVTFAIDRILFVRDRSAEKPEGEVVLTFAGGETAEGILQVSDVPDFDLQSLYIVLARSDGKSYFSPVIGGSQGLFRVVTDDITGTLHPLTYGKRAIIAVDKKGKIMRGSRANLGIAHGKARKKTMLLQDNTLSTAIAQPVPGSGALSASRVNPEASDKSLMLQKAETLMTLEDFVTKIEEMQANEGGK